MAAVALENVERRVLAQLPPWRSPEDITEAIRIETEGHTDDQVAGLKANPGGEDEREGTDDDPRVIKGVGHSIQSYKAPQVLDRMRIDDSFPMALAEYVIRTGNSSARPLDLDLTIEMLNLLKERGFAAEDEDGNWTMTQLGHESITYDKEVLKVEGAPDLPGAGGAPIVPTTGPVPVPEVAPVPDPAPVPVEVAIPTPAPEATT